MIGCWSGTFESWDGYTNCKIKNEKEIIIWQEKSKQKVQRIQGWQPVMVDGPTARHAVKILDICVMPHMTECNFNMSVIVEVMAIY